MRLLTAIVAPPGAGKTELGKALESDYGFQLVTGSDVIKRVHRILRPTEPPLDRSTIHAFQAEWRKEAGLDSVAAEVMRIMNETQGNIRMCYDGVRNRHDARRIQKEGGLIVALDCPLEMRHRRFMGREGKIITLDEYRDIEAKENEPDKEDGLHLNEVMAMATLRIDVAPPLAEVARTFISSLGALGIEI